LSTPDNCSVLVDDEGKYRYKWLELVADGDGIGQLLGSGRIGESQILGVDRDVNMVEKCRSVYPGIDYHVSEWATFCREYRGDDIGVINFDSWNAAYGSDFTSSLRAALILALRCKARIGECLLVINVDSGKTYRGYAEPRGMTSREVLKMNIEKVFSDRTFGSIEIDVGSMYEYRQQKRSTTMLSCGILL
jgi:hypothetical protein